MLDELEKPQQSLNKSAVSLIDSDVFADVIVVVVVSKASFCQTGMEAAANRLIQSEREGGGAFERQFTEFIPEPQASKIGIHLCSL